MRILYNALRKYEMVDTLELIQIDTANTLEELCEKEIRHIKEYNSYFVDGKGYNMTYGGEGVNGYVPTEENNQENRKRQKKYYQDNPEAKQQHSEKMKKYYENPEAIQQLSKKMKKYYEDNPDAGKERGEKIKKRYKDNPEAKKEFCEKMKKYYKDNPEARKKNSEKFKKYRENNPEFKQKRADKKGQNKPFDVFTTDVTFVKTFMYQFEAVQYLKEEHNIVSRINISDVLLGRSNSSVGFIFKYK